MSIIGVNAIINFASTYNLDTNGVLTRASGSDSFLTKGVLAGDTINVIGATAFIVEAVNSATSLQVTTVEGSTPAVSSIGSTGVSASNIYVQEAPKYIQNVTDPSSIGGRADIFGVSTTEQSVARSTYPTTSHPQHAGWVRAKNNYGYVTAVPVPLYPGSGYGATAPLLAFSYGGASGVASTTKGKVTGISISAGGSYTLIAPTASFTSPAPFTFNSKTAVGATSANITFAANHNLSTGDALVYFGATGVGTIGLTNATMYYAYVTGATGIQLFTSKATALASLGNVGATGLVTLTADPGAGVTVSLTGLTAGASGVGATGIGVGATGIAVTMGGRFGRTTFETLVVTKNITGATGTSMFPNS